MKPDVRINRIKERCNVQTLTVALLLIVSICFVIYCIFNCIAPYLLDSDIPRELSYRQKSFEQKNFFPEGFWSSNEAFTSRPLLLYWLFYGISGNYLLSYQLECATMLFLEVLAFYWLLKELRIAPIAKLVSTCVFVQWITLEAHGLSGVYTYPSDAYSLFLLAAIITLALELYIRRTLEQPPKTFTRLYVSILSLVGIATCCGYSTPKLALSLYLPLIVIDVVTLFKQYIEEKRTSNAANVIACIDFICLIANLVSYVLLVRFHSDSFHPMRMAFASTDRIVSWEVISGQMCSIISALVGYIPSVEVFSARGIRIVLRCAVVLVAYLVTAKKIKRENDFLSIFAVLSMGLMLLYVLAVGASNNSLSRYYYALNILIPIAIGYAIDQYVLKNAHQMVTFFFLVTSVSIALLLSCSGKITKAELSNVYIPLQDVAEYMEENEYQYISATYGAADIVKLATNGSVDAQQIDNVCNMSYSTWICDTSHYYTEDIGVPNILLLTDAEELAIENANNHSTVLLHECAEKVQEIDIYNLYALTENPFTLARKIEKLGQGGLPSAEEVSAVDYPTDTGYFFKNGILNEQKELVSDGTGTCILWGPYTESISGIYDITLHYVMESHGEDGTGEFDIALDAERRAVAEISPDSQTAFLDDVVIDAGHVFEARVYVPEGMVIRVQSIEYQRVGE